jgi:hypothetical protein
MPIIEKKKKNFDFSILKLIIESLFGYIASKKEAAPKQGKTQKKKILSGIVLKPIRNAGIFMGTDNNYNLGT